MIKGCMGKERFGKRGQSPHAAILLFIVIMILSTLIAGTIIVINNHLKNQAMNTESETEKEITTKFDIFRVEGYGKNDTHQINDIWVYARLSGGSQPIKLNNVMIQFETKYFISTLKYNNDSDYDNNFINSNHVHLKPKDILSNETVVFTRNDYDKDFLQDNISIYTNCSDYNWTTCYGFSRSTSCPGWTFEFIPPPYPNTPPGYTTNYYNQTRICTTTDTWVCEYWIYLQSRTCNHMNLTYTTNAINITCVTNTTYENYFDSQSNNFDMDSFLPIPNINTVWVYNTSSANASTYSESSWQNLNVYGIEPRTDTIGQSWIPSAPSLPPFGVPEGLFTSRWTRINITRWNYTDYTNITKTTVTNISNCTLNFIYFFWNTTDGCYNQTTQNNFTYRYDDNSREQFGFGNDTTSGVSKWININNPSNKENFTIRIYGRATRCNETAYQSYKLRVNDDVGQTIDINWCDEFNLDVLGPLQNSPYAWINFSIQQSWILNGENKFNFWEISDENISNWEIGFDTNTAMGRSGYCNKCMPPNPAEGENMAAREAMIYLTSINLTTEEVNCTLFEHNITIGNYTYCDRRIITNITIEKIQNTTKYTTTNTTFNDTINDTDCAYFGLPDYVDGPHPQVPVCGPWGIGCSFFDIRLSNGSNYLITTGTNLRDCGAEDDPSTTNITEAPCPVDVDYIAGQPGYPLPIDLHAHGIITTKNTFDSGIDFYSVYRDPNKLWMGKYTAEPYQLGGEFKPNEAHYGDTYIFHIFTPKPISEFEDVRIKFMPVHGLSSDISFITPNTITSDRTQLFPKN